MSFSKGIKAKQKPIQETDLLIESMQKLIEYHISQNQSHMNENQTHQEEIFKSLTSNDVVKIIQNFDDPNPIMRKTSAAFLCELVYDNERVQQGFCDITKILQAEGKVCVTKIPQTFLAHAKALPEIFDIIKNTPPPSEYPIGWYYEIPVDKNYKKGLKYLKFERSQGKNVKQRVQQFIDPQNCLFGFFVKPLRQSESRGSKQKVVPDKQFQSEQQQEIPLPKPKEYHLAPGKYTTQQTSTSQSPQHHIPTRKPISVLNHSVDFGTVSSISSTREHQHDVTANPQYVKKSQKLANKTFVEGEQFVIKEESGHARPDHLYAKPLGQNQKVLKDRAQVKRVPKVSQK